MSTAGALPPPNADSSAIAAEATPSVPVPKSAPNGPSAPASPAKPAERGARRSASAQARSGDERARRATSTAEPLRREQGSAQTRVSSLFALPIEDAESTLQTLPLQRFKGADHAEALAAQLAAWVPAFTSSNAAPRFRLDGRLGEGAQGVIFSVLDRDCRRTVALKTLHADGLDATEVSRFIHEAQVTAQLEHPGIVPVHDFGVLPDGTVFYTMKRIGGESLAAAMQARATAGERFALIDVFLRVCETVGFAHSRGVVHRDLKPRNIMVGSYGEVLVMDWGLAKILGAPDAPRRISSLRVDGGDGSDVHRTLEGFAVGTPAYMSPEQARGEAASVDERSDLYSLGVILYELLAGRSPYERGDVRQTLEQVAAGRWRRLDELDDDDGQPIDRRLRAIAHKAMAFKQSERYADVAGLAADLRHYLADRAVSAHRDSRFERLVRGYRRHRPAVLTALAASALAAAIALTALTVGHWRRALAMAAHRGAAESAEGRGDAASLEEARRELVLLSDLAGGDARALRHAAELAERASAAREREADSALRAQRRAQAAEALALAPADNSPAALAATAQRVLDALGLVQSDDDAQALRNLLAARYEALVVRRLRLGDGAAR